MSGEIRVTLIEDPSLCPDCGAPGLPDPEFASTSFCGNELVCGTPSCTVVEFDGVCGTVRRISDFQDLENDA